MHEYESAVSTYRGVLKQYIIRLDINLENIILFNLQHDTLEGDCQFINN